MMLLKLRIFSQICLLLAGSINASVVLAQDGESSLVASTDRYEFHSNFWINLHHFLYAEAKRPADAKLRSSRRVGYGIAESTMARGAVLLFRQSLQPLIESRQ